MDKSVLFAIVLVLAGFFTFMFSVVLFNEWFQKKRRERRDRMQPMTDRH